MGIIRSMEESDLDNVLRWRNHPSIRRSMLTQHEISLSEHTDWFKSIQSDVNKYPMIYEEDGVPLGYVNFNIIPESSSANWGFYSAPDSPKGTGTRLGLSALDYAFKKLNLDKVCGQALSSNKASVNFHLKLGFIKEGVLREQSKQGLKYQDIICYSFLREDWIRKLAHKDV